MSVACSTSIPSPESAMQGEGFNDAGKRLQGHLRIRPHRLPFPGFSTGKRPCAIGDMPSCRHVGLHSIADHQLAMKRKGYSWRKNRGRVKGREMILPGARSTIPSQSASYPGSLPRTTTEYPPGCKPPADQKPCASGAMVFICQLRSGCFVNQLRTRVNASSTLCR